jgi:hypothetical protein
VDREGHQKEEAQPHARVSWRQYIEQAQERRREAYEKYQDYRDEIARRARHFWSDLTPQDKVRLGLEGVIAASTFAYFCIAAFQWCVMQQTLESANRAWVVVDKTMLLATELRPMVSNSIQVSIKNAGQGPAMRLTAVAHPKLSKDRHLRAPIREMMRTGGSKIVVGPGQTYFVTLEVRGLSPKKIKAIERRWITLLVYGNLRYADQFSERRWTRFCSVYLPGPVHDFAFCADYNDAG